VLAVLWLFALRPLSVGDILLVLVVALVVGWILELLQRRDDEPLIEEPAPPADADTLVIAGSDAPPEAIASEPAAPAPAKKTPKR
jgi:hypothetical protein